MSIDYSRLAEIYDIYVRVTQDIPFFLRETKKTDGSVLELMAGTGRLSLPLLAAGGQVVAQIKMLVILRKKLAARGMIAPIYQMDVCQLALARQYDLILLPFNSFSEITSQADQLLALRRIYDHLADGGRFICTLHNPVIRLKTLDGQLRLIGDYPRSDGKGRLFFWLIEKLDSQTGIVDGRQFYEEYDEKGTMVSKFFVDTNFALISKEQFENLASEAGLEVTDLYGDYGYDEFTPEESPSLVYVFEKRSKK